MVVIYKFMATSIISTGRDLHRLHTTEDNGTNLDRPLADWGPLSPFRKH